MILAAGFDVRIRPFTLAPPKPLIQVARGNPGSTATSIASLNGGGEVVNIHHLGEQIVQHVKRRMAPRVTISDESDALLDTVVVRALPLLGAEPFFLLNSDVLWGDGPHPTFSRLWSAFDPAETDMVVVLLATAKAHGYDGPGDFLSSSTPKAARSGPARWGSHPSIFAGVSLIHPWAFAGAPQGAFLLNRILGALAAGMLRGLAHEGGLGVSHVGTPGGDRRHRTPARPAAVFVKQEARHAPGLQR